MKKKYLKRYNVEKKNLFSNDKCFCLDQKAVKISSNASTKHNSTFFYISDWEQHPITPSKIAFGNI